MQANLQNTRVSDFTITDRLRLGKNTKVLSGTYTMTAGDPVLQFLDANGAARDVLLPPISDGLVYVVVNRAAAAFALTVKDSTGVTTVAVAAQNKSAILFCNGVAWAGIVGA